MDPILQQNVDSLRSGGASEGVIAQFMQQNSGTDQSQVKIQAPATPEHVDAPKSPEPLSSHEGYNLLNSLRAGGADDGVVNMFKARQSTDLLNQGHNTKDLMDYWGDEAPDTAAMADFIKKNVEEAKKQGVSTDGGPAKVMSWTDALDAGWQMGITDLKLRGQMPDMVLGKDATTFQKSLYGLAMTVGDAPVMIIGKGLGSIGGGVAGGVLSDLFAGPEAIPAGVAAGEGFGGMAGMSGLPAFYRKWLVDGYQKGSIKDKNDFLQRLYDASYEGLKGAGIGMAAYGAGQIAGIASKSAIGSFNSLGTVGNETAPFISNQVASKITNAAKVTSEYAAMTTAGAAMEGHIPDANEFVTNALTLGMFHAAPLIQSNLGKLFIGTGARPEVISEMAKTDQAVKEQVLANPNPEIGNDVDIHKILNPEISPQEEEIAIKKDKTEVGTVKLRNKDLPRTESEMAMLNKIGENTTEPSFFDKAKESLSPEKLVTNLLDDLNPLKVAVKNMANGVGLDLEKDPYILGRLYRGWHGRLQRMVEFGTYDFNDSETPTGEGLKSVLKDVPDGDLDGLTAYGMAARTVEKAGQISQKGPNKGQPIAAFGDETFDSDLASAKQVLKEGSRFKDSFDRLVGFSNRTLDYAEQAGLLSKETTEQFRQLNKHYFPFHRVMDVDPLTGEQRKAGGLGSFKEFGGSDREVRDPLNTILNNTAAIIRSSERNRVYSALLKLNDQYKSSTDIEDKTTFIEKSQGKVKPVKITDKETAKMLDSLGVDPSIAAEGFTVFRRADHQLQDNEFVHYDDGKKTIYKTTPEIADALNAMDVKPGITGFWGNLLFRLPAKVLRYGTTATPDFIVRNALRDQYTAAIQSKYGTLPFYDVLHHGVGGMFAEGEHWQNFLSSGGAGGAFGQISRYLETDLSDLNEKTNFTSATRNLIRNPMDFVNAMRDVTEDPVDFAKSIGKKTKSLAKSIGRASETIETLPRFTEFMNAGGGAAGGFQARDVTVDFSMAGKSLRSFGAATPFFTANIAGVSKMYRTLKENPAGTAVRAMTYVTMPSIANWAKNNIKMQDGKFIYSPDSRVKNAAAYDRDFNYLITTDKWVPVTDASEMNVEPDLLKRENGIMMVNHGNVLKVVKPFEYGMLFGSLVERTLDAFAQKSVNEGNFDTAFKGFGSSMASALLPNLMVTAAQPIAEHMSNQSFFTTRPIVNGLLEKELPQDQYNIYTSETAKLIAKGFQHMPMLTEAYNNFIHAPENVTLASPAVIDNYLRTSLGTMGQWGISMTDAALEKAGISQPQGVLPSKTMWEWPFLKSFSLRYPAMTAQPIQDFYDTYNKVKRSSDSLSSQKSQGNIGRMNEIQQENGQDIIMSRLMEPVRKQMSSINKQMQMIYKDPQMGADDKRKLLDMKAFQMIMLSKAANIQAFRMMKEQGNINQGR